MGCVTAAPRLRSRSPPAWGWGAGKRTHLSFLGARGDLNPSNQRHVLRITLERQRHRVPSAAPPQRNPAAGSPGRPLYAPTPRRTQEPVSNKESGRAPREGPHPDPDPRRVAPRAALGQKRGTDSLTRAAKASREPRPALAPPPLQTRRCREPVRRVPAGPSGAGASGQAREGASGKVRS